ncbi:hypothetical protein JD844_025915 [Phrynosoma platyrhinos]|uniref:Uncharacterized protein n=1 Tax=Phrynosoma platyrhinos TaxID=52577 RepID=A0ABQ7SZX1_PHRPL|nr:hypothetical protein JD844_025915 [Phrynosoma platyrhinos]
MQQQVLLRDEETMELRETFTTLQQELYAKLQAVKAEIQDQHDEYIRVRQDLEEAQNEQTRELKLKYLIIENFIPPEEKNKIMNRLYFDCEEDQWKFQPLVLGLGRSQEGSLKQSLICHPAPSLASRLIPCFALLVGTEEGCLTHLPKHWDQAQPTDAPVPIHHSKNESLGTNSGSGISLSSTNTGTQMKKRPTSAVGYKRPISQYARLAMSMGSHPRYRAENIMFLELDISPPAIFEFEITCDQNEQDPRARHQERLMCLDSLLERPTASQVPDSSLLAILNNTRVPRLQFTEPFHSTGSPVACVPALLPLCPSFALGGPCSFSCRGLTLGTRGGDGSSTTLSGSVNSIYLTYLFMVYLCDDDDDDDDDDVIMGRDSD